MSFRNVYEDLALALSCFCMMVLFCSGSYFYALPFIIYAIVNGNWMKKLETKPKKVKRVIPKFPTYSSKPTDLMWYESEAPRLENNPFAYAYIINPFCGDDFPPMGPPIKGSFPKNSSLLFIYA
ncbi:hypothetical protein NPIL_663011 [Nephila pilipes]|uniref:Uncharacterized protein n=1 Tax=Nephila pilipes TaxID=299642 RepID=A0A8X6T1I7_NEPPI|nr:hypothetical protein NPIL_614451 [Nephila pilipes]GFS96345.1 hypothetical protein NPIL_663011 [Nephila pilipes]